MDNEDSIESLKFENSIPAPLPGLFYMEMIPEVSTDGHSDVLDDDYRIIHTPINQLFPIDVLAELRTGEKTESWLRQNTQIDSLYYQEKSDRNELLMRDEQKKNIKDVLDYQKYLEETFEKVNEKNPDIVEEYPLLLGDDRYVLLTFNEDTNTSNLVGESFRLMKSDTSLVEKCEINGETYNSTKLHIEDKLCIEIKEGKAYYTPVNFVYKMNK